MKKLCVYKAKNTHTFFKKILHRIFPPLELSTFFFFLFFLLEIFLRSRVDEHSRIIKSRVMQNFKVRTYDVQQATPKTAIFILNRGRNAGKPLQEPCPNCFILYCSSLEEMENVYWTFYALWKHGFFHPYLCGSVIEMLRISELKTLMRNFIIPALEKSSQNPEMTLKIKSTWELEKKIEQQAKAVKELRDSLVRRYYLSM